jgi:hypothetical protein
VILNDRISALTRLLLTLLTRALITMFIQPVFASPEFSEQTGKVCSACHKKPDGGGALT